jgi:hypothetical protein
MGNLEIRHALRMFFKSLGFTVTAVAALVTSAMIWAARTRGDPHPMQALRVE